MLAVCFNIKGSYMADIFRLSLLVFTAGSSEDNRMDAGHEKELIMSQKHYREYLKGSCPRP